MIVLKNLEIEESLTRQVKVTRWHQCAYCEKNILEKGFAIKASFRYDRKLYPLYFHDGDNNCYLKFKDTIK